jgi:hypothetical protein
MPADFGQTIPPTPQPGQGEDQTAQPARGEHPMGAIR